MEIWFGIANGQILSDFIKFWWEYMPETYFRFQTITWVNVKGFWPNLEHALILRRSGLGMFMGKFCQFLTALSACDTLLVGYYHLTFLFGRKKHLIWSYCKGQISHTATQSDNGLCYTFMYSAIASISVSSQQRSWSDCIDLEVTWPNLTQQDASNEYPQCVLLLRNKKHNNTFWL